MTPDRSKVPNQPEEPVQDWGGLIQMLADGEQHQSRSSELEALGLLSEGEPETSITC